MLVTFVLLVTGITLTMLPNRNNSYKNTEYKYSLSYPVGFELIFISGTDDVSITRADTIGIKNADLSLRIQATKSVNTPTEGDLTKVGNNDFRYHGNKQLCSYTISGPNSSLCITLDLSPEELMKNPELFLIFKSIKLY